MSNIPSPGEKIIDSRDIIARMEELQSEREALAEDVQTAEETLSDMDDETPSHERASAEETLSQARQELVEWDEENGDELKTLQECNEEGEGYGDWSHGETMIHEDYREDYVQEWLSDCGDMPRDGFPSWIEIDWKATADNFFRYDYHEIQFGGETYYIRA